MGRALAAGAIVFWAGAALVLSQLRWFARRPLVERLRPYEPGGLGASPSAGRPLLSARSIREVLGPAAADLGERLARSLGVREAAAVRLRRIHAELDVATFRVRELGRAGAGLAIGAVLTVATRPPLAVALLFTLGGALLGFLVEEQRLATASARWQRRTFLELPVVSEQLGMLLGAGYSLGAALNRLADRGGGACGRDLAVVCSRIRHGLTEVDGLREWAAIANVPALTRLVAVLALNREAGDLGRLVSEEARSIRREVHRELVAQIERRAQQVWIPVTVATLVPGAVLLAIPFVEALRLFSSS